MTTEAEKCAICLGDLNVAASIDGCNHVFCFECIKQWSDVENTCPFCKESFTKIEQRDPPANARTRKKSHTVTARRQRVSNDYLPWGLEDFHGGMVGEIRVAFLGPIGAMFALQRALMLNEALEDDEEDDDYFPPDRDYDSFEEPFWQDDEEDEEDADWVGWQELDADVQVWRGTPQTGQFISASNILREGRGSNTRRGRARGAADTGRASASPARRRRRGTGDADDEADAPPRSRRRRTQSGDAEEPAPAVTRPSTTRVRRGPLRRPRQTEDAAASVPPTTTARGRRARRSVPTGAVDAAQGVEPATSSRAGSSSSSSNTSAPATPSMPSGATTRASSSRRSSSRRAAPRS